MQALVLEDCLLDQRKDKATPLQHHVGCGLLQLWALETLHPFLGRCRAPFNPSSSPKMPRISEVFDESLRDHA